MINFGRTVEDCTCWQGRRIDHRTYEKITSNETVDSTVLSTCLSVAYFVLETVHTKSMPLCMELTEWQKHHMQVIWFWGDMQMIWLFFYIILYYFMILLCIVLYIMIQYCIILYCIFNLLFYHMIQLHKILQNIILYPMIQYCIFYNIVSYNIV